MRHDVAREDMGRDEKSKGERKRMKRCALFAILAFCLAVPTFLSAQSSSDDYNHGEAGVFVDYFDLSRTTPNINFVGLGGRAAFNLRPNVQLEAEMAYDFKRNFTSTFSNGFTTQLVNTRLRTLHALFGPKFQTSGPFRAYVTGKLGFVNFGTSDQNATAGFRGALGSVTDGNTRFALYPGAGVEGFWGPIGLRLEVGDEVYFDDGAQNNLKVTFGPQFRF
jgi:opacity protein-like surface antigen